MFVNLMKCSPQGTYWLPKLYALNLFAIWLHHKRSNVRLIMWLFDYYIYVYILNAGYNDFDGIRWNGHEVQIHSILINLSNFPKFVYWCAFVLVFRTKNEIPMVHNLNFSRQIIANNMMKCIYHVLKKNICRTKINSQKEQKIN